MSKVCPTCDRVAWSDADMCNFALGILSGLWDVVRERAPEPPKITRKDLIAGVIATFAEEAHRYPEWNPDTSPAGVTKSAGGSSEPEGGGR